MRVCIDPGHGMGNRQPGVYDPGTTHLENGVQFDEAGVVLRYALALKDALRRLSVDVFMTRDDAQDPAPLARRARMAEEAGCTVLVSIHVNGGESDQANGIEVLVHDENSNNLANKVLASLVSITGLRNRGVKLRPDLAVLKFRGPAVLLELGFLANDGDRMRILDAGVRHRVAEQLAEDLRQLNSP